MGWPQLLPQLLLLASLQAGEWGVQPGSAWGLGEPREGCDLHLEQGDCWGSRPGSHSNTQRAGSPQPLTLLPPQAWRGRHPGQRASPAVCHTSARGEGARRVGVVISSLQGLKVSLSLL